jgi:hypothetical protein
MTVGRLRLIEREGNSRVSRFGTPEEAALLRRLVPAVALCAFVAVTGSSSAAPQTRSTESTDAFAVFSAKTGKRDARFPRMVRDETHSPEVLALVADGSGGWFVGGEFGTRDGVKCRNLAHFSSDGRLDGRSCLAPNDRVTALRIYQGVLYVAGSFTRIGGAHRNYLAAVDVASGRLRRWDPLLAGKVYYDRSNEIPRGVWALAARGEVLYVAGQFDSAGGLPRKSVAALELADARPTRFRAPEPSFDGYSPTLVVVTGSSVIVNGGVGSDPASGKLVSLDRRSGKRQSWSLQGPEQTNDLLSYGNTLLAAHTVYACGNSNFLVVQYRALTGRRLRTIASSIDKSCATSNITTLHLDGSRLYVGGVFARINSTVRASLASFRLPSKRPLPWHPLGAREFFGDTLAIATAGEQVAVGVGTCRPNC